MVLTNPEIKRPHGARPLRTVHACCIYESECDTSCIADEWFENVEQALDYSNAVYGVKNAEWSVIGATPQHCQDDWITPTRIPGREIGKPEWDGCNNL